VFNDYIDVVKDMHDINYYEINCRDGRSIPCH